MPDTNKRKMQHVSFLSRRVPINPEVCHNYTLSGRLEKCRFAMHSKSIHHERCIIAKGQPVDCHFRPV